MTARSVVVAGAGLAAARAAETLRAEGFDGRVVLVGEEPIAPYERPALSKEFLAGSRDEESLLLRKRGYWENRGIELLLGRRVVSVHPERRALRTSRDEELRFEELVVATGARPRRLTHQVPDGVHELRTLADARVLREELAPGVRLVVVGGGFVGAEVASTARSLGADVTIVEAAAAPIARVLGDTVGRLLAERWRAHGIDVRLQTGAAAFSSNASGRITTLLLTDGTEKRAEIVLVGIGVEPARELLPERPATFIHPAGDVVGPGHWTAAALDGATAARRILGLPAVPPAPSYMWSDQFGLRLQVVGDPHPDDPFVLDGDDDSFCVRYLDRHGGTRAALFANRPTDAAALRRRMTETSLACAA
jgi:3-phenylpropionate/trans-cinnamate dioxygenase ferredoxin reductase subunit